jgi:phospholipase/lecithinase/hemolysin
MSTIMQRHRVSTLAILALCWAFIASSATPLSAQGPPVPVVVFGDSLSDPGNAFAFVKTSGTPPDYNGMNALLIPNVPYARGGHHVSNGETWIEQLAGPLGARRSVLPAFASSNPFAMNFAIATARARTIPPSPPQNDVIPSLSLEVAAFLQKTGGQVPSDALYVIEVGGQDVSDAVANPAQASAILLEAANAIRDNIALLHSLGAQNFLVWNVPNVGLTPAARMSGAGAIAAGTTATATFNALLAVRIAALSAAGVNIIPFDANGLFEDVIDNPAKYGFSNVTQACVTPNEPPFTCQAADEYLFWDGIHPTAAGHTVIAEAVAQLLGL